VAAARSIPLSLRPPLLSSGLARLVGVGAQGNSAAPPRVPAQAASSFVLNKSWAPAAATLVGPPPRPPPPPPPPPKSAVKADESEKNLPLAHAVFRRLQIASDFCAWLRELPRGADETVNTTPESYVRSLFETGSGQVVNPGERVHRENSSKCRNAGSFSEVESSRRFALLGPLRHHHHGLGRRHGQHRSPPGEQEPLPQRRRAASTPEGEERRRARRRRRTSPSG